MKQLFGLFLIAIMSFPFNVFAKLTPDQQAELTAEVKAGRHYAVFASLALNQVPLLQILPTAEELDGLRVDIERGDTSILDNADLTLNKQIWLQLASHCGNSDYADCTLTFPDYPYRECKGKRPSTCRNPNAEVRCIDGVWICKHSRSG